MEQNLGNKTSKVKKIGSIILSIFLIIGGALMCYPTSIQKKLDNAYNLGYSIGVAGTIAVIIAIICFTLNKTVLKGEKKAGLVAFSSIFIIAATCKYAYGMIEDTKEESAKAYITSISKKLLNEERLPITTAGKNEYGKLTPLVQIVNEETKAMILLPKNIKKQFEESKIKDDMSSFKCIENAEATKKTSEKISNLKNLVAKNQSNLKENKSNIDKKMSQYKGVNTEFEKDLIDEYNKRRKETYDKNDKELSKLIKVVETFDKFFQFMKSKEGEYKIVGRTIQFYNESDVTECNKLIADIKKLAVEMKLK